MKTIFQTILQVDKDGKHRSNSQLDDEMEKVFKDDKFDLAKITSSTSQLTNQKFEINDTNAQHSKRINEQDYECKDFFLFPLNLRLFKAKEKKNVKISTFPAHRKALHFYHTPHKSSPLRNREMKLSENGDQTSPTKTQESSVEATSVQAAAADQQLSESSDTPLSTAPTSPVSQSSSYKSGTLTEDGFTNAVAIAETSAGTPDSVVLQILDTVVQPTSVDSDQPQLSQRAAYGEQTVFIYFIL